MSPTTKCKCRSCPYALAVLLTYNSSVTKYAEATVTAEATQYQTAPVVIVTETANSQNVVQIVTEIFTQTAGYGYNAPAPAAPTSVSFEQVSTSAKAAAAAPTTSKIVVVTSSAAPAPAAPATTSSAVQVQAAPAAGWTSTYFSAWTSTWEIAPSSTSAAAPASTSAAAASPVSVSSYAQKILDAHNQYRAKHSAGALTWNTDMENFASTVSGKCVFEHSGGKYGENLAAGYDEDTAAVKAWYDENTQYNYSAGQFTVCCP